MTIDQVLIAIGEYSPLIVLAVVGLVEFCSFAFLDP